MPCFVDNLLYCFPVPCHLKLPGFGRDGFQTRLRALAWLMVAVETGLKPVSTVVELILRCLQKFKT